MLYSKLSNLTKKASLNYYIYIIKAIVTFY
jgi:hypothetical protein